MKTSLIFVLSGPEGYGIRSVWRTLFHILSRSNYQITISVLDNRYLESWQNEFAGVAVVCPSGRWEAFGNQRALGGLRNIVHRGLSQLKLINWLNAVVDDRSAAALVFQGPIDSLLCGIVARQCDIPALWFVPNAAGSGYFLDLNKRIYRSLFNCGNIIPLSNSRFTDSTFGKGNFERHVVHLGIDTNTFVPGVDGGTIREQYQIPREHHVIGLFARMTPSKGQLRLVEAMAALPEEFHVLLCGGPLSGEYCEAIERKISNLSLSGRVHFAGFQEDLRPYYAASDIIANLRSDPEPFGLTVVEAMACGKPVLAHAAGGPSETIIDGETGWLIHGSSSREIECGLSRAIGDSGRWHKMGILGRERVERCFSLDSFEARLLEVFRQVVGSQ